MPRRLKGKLLFFFYIQCVLGSGDFQQLWREICQSLQCTSNPSLCCVQVWATISIFPRHLREQRKLAEECAAEEVHKFHMGGKFKYGQGDPWQAVVETSQWCHLPLSNIISLAGLMLRTSDAASGEQTHANRGVTLLIDLPDQNQDNYTSPHYGRKSPSLLLNAQVLQFSSWNKISLKVINLVYTIKGCAIKSGFCHLSLLPLA